MDLSEQIRIIRAMHNVALDAALAIDRICHELFLACDDPDIAKDIHLIRCHIDEWYQDIVTAILLDHQIPLNQQQ